MAERQIDIEAKLTALLDLSKSTASGTEHEAKLALEMAIRLAAKHGISLSSLAAKRQMYAGDWFQSSSVETVTVEYEEGNFSAFSVRQWCELAESFNWERHRRNRDDREGSIWSYRQSNRDPKLELRIFERPWGDIEFEVMRNPDPILGQLDKYMTMGFDCVELGVMYHDLETWLRKDKVRPYV